MVRHEAEQRRPLPEEPRKLAAARYAMQLGLELERLTQPDVVDAELATRMVRLSRSTTTRSISASTAR
jgi:hypothetical protein